MPPLLFSLHPTSLSKWKSQLLILTCPAMIQRSPGGCLQVAVQSPLDDFPCLGCRQITPGSPSGVPTENGGCRCGHLWVFFHQLHPKFPRVAERRPASDWAALRGTPADELICVTSADHLAKFDCELKCSGRRMSKGWALQECLFGRRPPDFCRIWCKTRCTVIGRLIFLYCDVPIRWVNEQKLDSSCSVSWLRCRFVWRGFCLFFARGGAGNDPEAVGWLIELLNGLVWLIQLLDW